MVTISDGINGFFRWPYVALLGLGILFFVGYIVSYSVFQSSQILQTWLGRFTVVSIGSYLTVIFVDRTFREKEKREHERIRSIALRQLRRPVNRQLDLLAEWYIASSENMPEPEFETIQDLLAADDYTNTVKHLDFSKNCNKSLEHETWLDYSATELEKFSEEIEKILSQYGFAMDSEMVDVLQDLANASLLNMLVKSKEANIIVLIESIDERTGGEPRTFNIFASEGVEKYVEEYLQSMLLLVQYFNDEDRPDIHRVDTLDVYRDGQPEPQSARIDMSLDESNPAIRDTINEP